jgi:hypothetical protein
MAPILGLSGIGLVLALTLMALVIVQLIKAPSPYVLERNVHGGSAKLHCLANNTCPVGQKCTGGFCSEGFMAPVVSISSDMSSCGAKECQGINAPCRRTGTPCAEGTFCQGDKCVNIAAPDEGEAYNQIGGLL